ncbi:uncharacterized protein SAPINGB_P002785 [Magnusiomyces paraingens]|uniref:Uncharacterized protein n=1 Tax=Magnusiomyces paraingens TaxID=2606893 RepID=A0A5E8BP10_9ASCO|nr:uncharacterized protein SAPINGB_P002785 [Saprochaete ingens]VVT50503.1 unnamed protein product [Saprochaete ingens]
MRRYMSKLQVIISNKYLFFQELHLNVNILRMLTLNFDEIPEVCASDLSKLSLIEELFIHSMTVYYSEGEIYISRNLANISNVKLNLKKCVLQICGFSRRLRFIPMTSQHTFPIISEIRFDNNYDPLSIKDLITPIRFPNIKTTTFPMSAQVFNLNWEYLSSVTINTYWAASLPLNKNVFDSVPFLPNVTKVSLEIDPFFLNGEKGVVLYSYLEYHCKSLALKRLDKLTDDYADSNSKLKELLNEYNTTATPPLEEFEMEKISTAIKSLAFNHMDNDYAQLDLKEMFDQFNGFFGSLRLVNSFLSEMEKKLPSTQYLLIQDVKKYSFFYPLTNLINLCFDQKNLLQILIKYPVPEKKKREIESEGFDFKFDWLKPIPWTYQKVDNNESSICIDVGKRRNFSQELISIPDQYYPNIDELDFNGWV